MDQPWLVTGAAGFLGSHVIKSLLLKNIPVIALDNLAIGKWKFLAPFLTNSRFKFVCQDIRDEPGLANLCQRERPGTAIHLAALHFIPAATSKPRLTIGVNVDGTRCLLRACREAGVRRIWFASTADVYRVADKPHQESGEVCPFNVYGLSKWMGERLMEKEAGRQPEGHFVIGRLFNLYGPNETNPHIIPETISQIRKDRSGVLRLGSMTPRRDLVYVADAARAVIEMIEKSEPGITTVNIGTGVSVSMQEIVEEIACISGRKLAVETDSAKLRVLDRPHLQADVTALRSLIGWVPHGDLSRGLHELLRFEGLLG
jgi:UDP-glucose 4-epimerase